MKIKFIKEYVAVDPATNSGITYRFGEIEDIQEYTAEWLIDNGFAEEVIESGWWKPKLGDIYYIAYPNGIIVTCVWEGCTVDENRFSKGAIFKTRTAVERYRDYLKAVATVRQDEGVIDLQEVRERREAGSEYDDVYAYTIAYDFYERKLVIISSFDCMSANGIWFDTRKHAEASLDNHPDEWQVIANYDWSKE